MRVTQYQPSRPPNSSCGARRLLSLIAVLSVAGGVPAHAQEVNDPTPQTSPNAARPAFRDLLVWSDILPQSLSEIPAASSPTATQRQLIEQVLFRLARVDAAVLAAATPWQPSASQEARPLLGDIVELQGRVVQVDRLRSAGRSEDGRSTIRCVMRLDSSDGQAVIWTSRVPDAWLSSERLNERAAIRGAFAGVRDGNASRALVALADRVAWHPDDKGLVETTLGRRVLGGLGVDVGRLDEIEHRTRLSRRDRAAFYSMLTAVKQTEPPALMRAARMGLDSYAQPWRELPAADLRTRAPLAKAVIDAAAKGQYSVAPLFLDAEHQTGQLVLLEGIARRAIRIEVDHAPPNAEIAAPASRLDHYFELEIFTYDSENLAVVCCVPSLPAGFPLGDAIREPVRIAGFFFKLWRYDSRTPREASEGVLEFQPTAAPLLIAAEPRWPLVNQQTASDVIGWIIAGVFVAAAAAIGGVAWWWSRGDRRIRRRMRPTTDRPLDIS